MNVLAIGAHPDDLEASCGGTLAKYSACGHKVFMCHIATGNVGHRIIQPEALVEIRKKEAEAAGNLIGAEVISIGESDLFIRSDNMETRDKIVDLIRYVQPDVIITHSPHDYMADHEEASRLVYEASMAATVSHHHTQHAFYSKITPIYYMEPACGVNSNPIEFVDISDVIDIKLNMVAKHESQIKWLLDHDNMDFIDMVKTMSKFRGYQCDTNYVEGFSYCQTYHKLITRRMLP